MITLVLTYRNRSEDILVKCLDSLATQSTKNFNTVLVNYGSNKTHTELLENTLKNYSFINYLFCDVSQQLWCKSKAINTVLKKCDTSHFFVGDIDMMYHKNFIETLETLKNKSVTYFQVGFLSQTESSKEVTNFEDYAINFKSNEEATGMTLYPTDVLKGINGYDEFYHGWGSEDTDTHLRLKNQGHTINYYDKDILMLHQWHPKAYRTKYSKEPYHSSLEQINASYLQLAEKTKRIKANLSFNWGIYNASDYKTLETLNTTMQLTNKASEIAAFVNGHILQHTDCVLQVTVSEHRDYKSGKQLLKKALKKKTIDFLSMQQVNDNLLEIIIAKFRDKPYKYIYNQRLQEIQLTIKL